MRITNRMMSGTVSTNLSKSLDRMMNLQNQLSSGKRIQRASEDPVGATQSVSLRSSVASIQQQERNGVQARARLAQVDSALGNVTKALQESKRLALAGANDTTDAQQKQNLALQVQQQIDFIVNEMNGTYLNRYTFGGHQTEQPPITANTGEAAPYRYNGDDGITLAPINDSTDVAVSLTAREILNMDGAMDPSKPDVLTVLTNIKKGLETGNTEMVQDGLKNLEAGSQNVISQRGRMGARTLQLETYVERLQESRLTVSQWLSEVEDVDIAEAISDLQAEQNVYQAALIAASRLVQPSLADFLK